MTHSSQNIEVPFVSDEPDRFRPAYAHNGDAAADLRAACSGVIEPGMRMLIPCGFAMALPEGYAGLVLPRSGLAAHHGITVLNAPGLIDSSYRGELMVSLLNTDRDNAFEFAKGDRIAQLLVIPYPQVSFSQVGQIDETERGVGGFGSSGIA